MIELITAIALWCGEPLQGGITINSRSFKEVQACRDELMACLEKASHAHQTECFKKKKIWVPEK